MRLVAALAVLVLLLAGCADTPGVTAPDLSTKVDVDTKELRRAKQAIGVEPCPSVRGTSDLPPVELPCLGGGRPVDLAEVPGPAVISLWASWCTSCPDELPLYERLSKETTGRLTVGGIDYQDTQPGKAMELLRLTRATFWQLGDPGGELADHYRLNGLPAILLVDQKGRVTFKKMVIESYQQLTDLVAQHTGVAVRAG